MEESRSKVVYKASCVFVVDNYSKRIRRGIGVGNPIQSAPFEVGGHSFIIQLYPDGDDLPSHRDGLMSLFLRHQTAAPAAVDLALGLLIVNQYWKPDIDLDMGFSSLHLKRGEPFTYRRVVTMEPGARCGRSAFARRSYIEQDPLRIYLVGDRLMIRATLAVFHDRPLLHLPPSFERCVLFQVGDRRYYAEEAVLRTRCPALLSASDGIVTISGVDTSVFEGVLWFIFNKRLHKLDGKANISNGGSDGLFVKKMVAAADMFELKDLRRHCESFLSYGEAAQVYYHTGAKLKECWSQVVGKIDQVTPQKVKDFIPLKIIKEA